MLQKPWTRSRLITAELVTFPRFLFFICRWILEEHRIKIANQGKLGEKLNQSWYLPESSIRNILLISYKKFTKPTSTFHLIDVNFRRLKHNGKLCLMNSLGLINKIHSFSKLNCDSQYGKISQNFAHSIHKRSGRFELELVTVMKKNISFV
jgi:hypothetical protein